MSNEDIKNVSEHSGESGKEAPLSPSQKSMKLYNLAPDESALLSGTKEEAESYQNPWQPGRRAYGALPHFDGRDRIIDEFPDEADYFAKHYRTGEGPPWRDPAYAEGAILFEMKFGKKLSLFCEEVLENYPDLGTEEPGKEISVFGLSGSGKSSVIDAVKEELGKNTVIMDSDTVRYNLLAKLIKDVETGAGADLDEVRQHLMHNNISGALYFMLNHVTKELKDRGYDVIQSSTMPTQGADKTVYVEHPDGIDPSQLEESKFEEVAKDLYARTEARTHGPDNYDWEHAETITRFEDMKDVAVQVPMPVHNIFLKNIKESLEKGEDIVRLKNPKSDDPGRRKKMMVERMKEILG